jgi:hypothetical protein
MIADRTGIDRDAAWALRLILRDTGPNSSPLPVDTYGVRRAKFGASRAQSASVL